MDIVADTNIFLAVALDEPEKNDIIQLTSGGEIFSPEILPYEIGKALSAMVKREKLTQKEALSAHKKANSISVIIRGHNTISFFFSSSSRTPLGYGDPNCFADSFTEWDNLGTQ